MTNVINLKHSTPGRIYSRLKQLQVESTAGRINSRLILLQVAKVKEGKTQQAAGLLRFTRLKSGDPVVFHALPRESADPRQARPGSTRRSRLSRPRAYTRVGAGAEIGAGAEAGAVFNIKPS